MFHDYMERFETRDFRRALMELFSVLDIKPEERDPYLDESLAAFPFVNGSLFNGKETIEVPQFTDEIIDIILNQASSDFDWSEISPTIFGAVFESTLNPETRRSGGMHYTSIENIHKVISPLFLEELRNELEEIKAISVVKTRIAKLVKYQEKLASLNFLDPACGSGNFLTESYICIRHLENEALKLKADGQIVFGEAVNPIMVSIGQFYGIEINDFAVTVAKTALWIAESQMMKETEDIIHQQLDFLPLESYACIVEGNALRMDWNDVISKEKLNYIMGNPPFIGHQWRTKEQQRDMEIVFGENSKVGKLDYVCCWYYKAIDYVEQLNVITAFVSTNSIVQGESVAIMWKPIFEKGFQITFAHSTFIWKSEAKGQAAVHCVIIGFTKNGLQTSKKYIYNNDGRMEATNINGYLLDAPSVFIQARGRPLHGDMLKMSKGSQPTDGGNLIMTTDEKKDLEKDYPITKKWIKRFMMGEDFINNKYRYCLWLKGVSPAEYRNIRPIIDRLEKVSELRKKSPTKSVQRDAETPMLFTQIRQPTTDYLVIPKVSSERRRYIPMAFMTPDIIVGDMCQYVPQATIYQFGILTSNVHMAWMRAVAGRLKSDFRYSPAVYNNFPWCNPTPEQKAKIEDTAQRILEARALYPDSSLADLYDPLTMPPELRRAHTENDKAVMKAYGFNIKEMSEADCVVRLMEMYQELIT